MKHATFKPLPLLALLLSGTAFAHGNPDTAALRAMVDAEKPVYIVTNRNNFDNSAKMATQLSSVQAKRGVGQGQELIVAKLAQYQIPELTQNIHETERTCGGYHAFSTQAEAEAFAKTADAIAQRAMNTQFASYTIDQQTLVKPWIQKVEEAKIRATITSLSTNWPNRYYATSNGKKASEWIKAQWDALAAGRSDISSTLHTTCGNCGVQPSVILTIKGSELPNEIVVLGGHLDSILASGSNSETTRAPGADDDASGIAVLTEVLRVLTSNNYKPKRTIQFMAYAAEEVGLRGSQAIASEYRRANKNVVAVLQLDMTNYRSSNGYDVYIQNSTSNNAVMQFFRDLFAAYLKPLGKTLGTSSCGYSCSDHASWTSAGFPAGMLDEGPIFSYLHTANDQLQYMGGTANHSVSFAQMGVAFAVELGKNGATGGGDDGGGDTTPPPPPPPPTSNVLKNGVATTGITLATKAQRTFTLAVPKNAANLNFKTSGGGDGDIDMYVKFGSAPTTASFDCKSTGPSATENCAIPKAQEGTYYVLLDAYDATEGVSLTGSYSEGTDGGGDTGGSKGENNTAFAIPDFNSMGARSPITLGGGGVGNNATLDVNITHPYIGDLVVQLIAPNGQIFTLHNREGKSTDNIVKSYPVSLGGLPVDGKWQLRVKDLAARDVGKLNSWKLSVQ